MKPQASEGDNKAESFAAKKAVENAARLRLLEASFAPSSEFDSYSVEDGETVKFLASLGDVTGLHNAKDENASDLPEGLMSGKPVSTNDQLLERLLGKREAMEHKKRQAKAKGQEEGAEPAVPVVKPVVKRKADVIAEESEDEEAGRGSTFRTKKLANPKVKISESLSAPELEPASTVVLDVGGDDTGAVKKQAVGTAKPRKPRPASYLDELLAKKGKKKGKISDNG